MPELSRDVFRRYGTAILSVGLAGVIRLAMDPILGDHYLFFFFFLAVVVAAGHGGYGPALLALVLSWLWADYLFLASGGSRHFFESKSQLGFAFLTVGLAITVLGGSLRAARERARASSSELQRAFEAQTAEREWLQITMASITDAVITTDPDGLVISLNPVAASLTAWSVSDAMGRPLREVFRLVQQTSLKTDELPVAKVVDGGQTILSDDEAVLIARDGTARSIEHNAAPIRDSGGKIKGVVIIFRDITERKRAEEELRQSDRRKEEFLAVLSHELRNPLAPIQTAVDLLEHAGTSQAGSERPLAMIKRQVGSLKRLVDDLLDISRISRGKIELRKELVELAAVVCSRNRGRPTAL